MLILTDKQNYEFQDDSESDSNKAEELEENIF